MSLYKSNLAPIEDIENLDLSLKKIEEDKFNFSKSDNNNSNFKRNKRKRKRKDKRN